MSFARGRGAALAVMAAGVAAAMHVAKIPVAIPELRAQLGVSLVQAGFLMTLVQLAGMALGLAAALCADALGARRSMLAGLVLLAVCGAMGAFARGAVELLALRGFEGLGLLLATAPGPGLMRRVARPQSRDAVLALWSAYMPIGAAAALLAGPWLLAAIGWRACWLGLAALTLGAAAWLVIAVEPDPGKGPGVRGSLSGFKSSLSRPGPWLVALAVPMYSGQWLAVVGFLPSIYAQAGISGPAVAAMSALAAAVNIAGNLAAGWLLQRGVGLVVILVAAFGAMAAGSIVAFAPELGAGPVARYVAILVFSGVGGMAPGTLFAICIRIARDQRDALATAGLMQQCSAMGQFACAPLVAWVASRAGGWHLTWAVSCAMSVVGVALSWQLALAIRRGAPPP